MFTHFYRVVICMFVMTTSIVYGLEPSWNKGAENVFRAVCSTGLIVGGLGFWKGAQPFFPIKGIQPARNPFLTAFVFSSAATQTINLKNQAQEFKNYLMQSAHNQAQPEVIQTPSMSMSHQRVAMCVAAGVVGVAVIGMFAKKYGSKFFGKAMSSRVVKSQAILQNIS